MKRSGIRGNCHHPPDFATLYPGYGQEPFPGLNPRMNAAEFD